MQVNPYLFFNGNCEAALKFYQKVLGAKIEGMLRYETGPADMPVPPEWKDKILHASRRDLRSPCRSTIPSMPSAGSRRCRKAAPSRWRSARLSSRRGSACASISSARPGW